MKFVTNWYYTQGADVELRGHVRPLFSVFFLCNLYQFDQVFLVLVNKKEKCPQLNFFLVIYCIVPSTNKISASAPGITHTKSTDGSGEHLYSK